MTDRNYNQTEVLKHPIVVIGLQQSQRKLTASKHQYSELQQFRQQIDHFFQPYHVHKRNAWAYRAIFWGIGLLFMILMLVTCSQNTNWFCGLYFSNCFFAKISLSGACAILALAAITVGTFIRAEKEAVMHLFGKVTRKIHKIYAHQCASLGWKRFLMFFQGCAQTASARRAYHDSLEKVHEIKDSTLQLMRHILQSRELDRQSRERLLNQALHEMSEQLDIVTHKLDSCT